MKLKTGIPAALAFLVLILDAKTAIYGATVGLQMCLQTVVPSLLPFFVLSMVLTSSIVGQNIRILRPVAKLFGIPKGAESLLVIGMLGGYPSGAQAVTQAYQSGGLRREDAHRMLAFCNLAGPSFLFGIVAGKFNSAAAAWLLWGIHILSAFLVSLILLGRSSGSASTPKGNPITLSVALRKSINVIAVVCGWIILFQVVIAVLDRWILWLLPPWMQVMITGLLELSNGCCDLGIITGEGLRFVVCSGMLAFGGLCVQMQTASVTDDLALKSYISGKILQGLFSITLSYVCQRFLFSYTDIVKIPLIFWLFLGIITAVLVYFLHGKQKNSSFSQLVGV